MEMSPQQHFLSARKLGMKEYSSKVSSGHVGYLPSLEGLLKGTEIVSHVDLGNIEIPLKKIVGTYSHLRSISFASNFMPIMKEDSEFEAKWIALCDAHLNEGIKHSIKVYEYLNWYYVIEGNKRVSVLKYFDAYSISANVTRLIPKLDENDLNIQVYYEFLKFNNKTKINSIWFSRRKSFHKLMEYLDKYNPDITEFDDKYKHFETYIYNPFRTIYHELGGGKLPITTGDAFLEYVKIYGIKDDVDDDKLSKRIKELIKELEYFKKDDLYDIQESPVQGNQGGVFSTISTLIKPQKKLKIAFVYARTAETSGWTYTHELGRQYLDEVLGDQITTSYIENVPENGGAYSRIKALALEGYDIIFTTSPVFRKDTLRCSLNYPQIKFFNCSENHPYKHMSNYYGRTYEPRFLTGIIAGAMTKNNTIGYAATSPAAEVISCINAFALGAKMVNPYVKVKVVWTREWNSHEKFTGADEKLMDLGCDIISNRNLTTPREVTKKYGVFSMLCSMDLQMRKPIHHLAAPTWHWGIFYEKIIRNILNNTFKTITEIFSNNTKLVNFWWGMGSGVLDIYYSKQYVPADTQKLVDIMKRMIINNEFNIFTGPVFDEKGSLKITEDDTATSTQVLKMNWFLDNVEVEPYK